MLKKLMQALYYPAVLGTGLVLLLNKLVIQPALSVAVADVTNYFAVLLILFFSIAYLVWSDARWDAQTRKDERG